MKKNRTEAIIVQAFPFKDYDRIITVITPNDGLLKWIIKGAFSSKNGKGSQSEPLTHIEAIYAPGCGDMGICSEISVLNSLGSLRKKFAHLQAACEMAKIISATQQPGKAAPMIYQLFLTYLTQLPNTPHPKAISCSFRLKTLRHEGILGPIDRCCTCSKELNDGFLLNGEIFCRADAPHGALWVSESERLHAELLAFGRDFNQLVSLPVEEDFCIKMQSFFSSSI